MDKDHKQDLRISRNLKVSYLLNSWIPTSKDIKIMSLKLRETMDLNDSLGPYNGKKECTIGEMKRGIFCLRRNLKTSHY